MHKASYYIIMYMMILDQSRAFIPRETIQPLSFELADTSPSSFYNTAPITVDLDRTSLPKVPITAHVSFEIEDKPWILMHILESFKVGRIWHS